MIYDLKMCKKTAVNLPRNALIRFASKPNNETVPSKIPGRVNIS